MRNLVPLPYRQVSFQPYEGEMTEASIRAQLLGREAYRRTTHVVLHQGKHTAVTSISTADREPLFSPIETVDVLALPDGCVFAELPELDPGNRSALAAAAHELGVGPEDTLVVRGKFDHVNFIHHPDPLVIRVVEVVPPRPPKLFSLAQHVLSYADLPPIRLELELFDLNDLVAEADPEAFLVPCRSGGLEGFSAPIYFLDERPQNRQDWLLIGCERSLEFHRHYYGDEPPQIEMCPRKLAGSRTEPTLLKCCLLEFAGELDHHVAVTPWGADLGQVEDALRELAETHFEEGRDDQSLV